MQAIQTQNPQAEAFVVGFYDFKLPTHLKKRLQQNHTQREDEAVLKERLAEKLARAEAKRQEKLERIKEKQVLHLAKIPGSKANLEENEKPLIQQRVLIMKQAQELKHKKSELLYQMALQEKVTKSQKLGVEAVEKAKAQREEIKNAQSMPDKPNLKLQEKLLQKQKRAEELRLAKLNKIKERNSRHQNRVQDTANR